MAARSTITKTPRVRKAVKSSSESAQTQTVVQPIHYFDQFSSLLEKITQVKSEFEQLQKEIEEVRKDWKKEQEDYKLLISERDKEDEIKRKREQETYDYEVSRKRKIAEDEYAQKAAAWERDLEQKRQTIETEHAELLELRKKASLFEEEKQKAVKEACLALEKELTKSFTTEKHLLEQETKAAKDLLQLRLETLTNQNSRQEKEIETFKKSLDEATRQIKEIALTVIESGGSNSKNTTQPKTEPSPS